MDNQDGPVVFDGHNEMVGVNFGVGFLREDGRWDTDTPLEAIVRRIDYLVERLGIDRVGFGSDFDGAPISQDFITHHSSEFWDNYFFGTTLANGHPIDLTQCDRHWTNDHRRMTNSMRLFFHSSTILRLSSKRGTVTFWTKLCQIHLMSVSKSIEFTFHFIGKVNSP